jgi:hypothetical protein
MPVRQNGGPTILIMGYVFEHNFGHEWRRIKDELSVDRITDPSRAGGEQLDSS